jgi:hypothetical protein
MTLEISIFNGEDGDGPIGVLVGELKPGMDCVEMEFVEEQEVVSCFLECDCIFLRDVCWQSLKRERILVLEIQVRHA